MNCVSWLESLLPPTSRYFHTKKHKLAYNKKKKKKWNHEITPRFSSHPPPLWIAQFNAFHPLPSQTASFFYTFYNQCISTVVQPYTLLRKAYILHQAAFTRMKKKPQKNLHKDETHCNGLLPTFHPASEIIQYSTEKGCMQLIVLHLEDKPLRMSGRDEEKTTNEGRR